MAASADNATHLLRLSHVYPFLKITGGCVWALKQVHNGRPALGIFSGLHKIQTALFLSLQVINPNTPSENQVDLLKSAMSRLLKKVSAI